MIFQLKPPHGDFQLHPLAMFDYRRVCFCNHGMSWAGNSWPLQFRQGVYHCYTLRPGARKFSNSLETVWDSHGFTQGTIGDRFGSKNEHNSWKMMNKWWKLMDIEWYHWIERNWWRLVAQICGLLAFFLLPWEGWLGASVSRFRKSDELQGFKLESGSMWPRGYEQPQSVTVPCNTNILCTTHGVFSPKSIALHCPGGKLSNDTS